AGITGLRRAESLNDDPIFIEAIANIAKDHLLSGKVMSTQLKLRCPKCNKDVCQRARDFFENQII
ncbi:12033_t:CDS:1, partial [Funneliformis caledonium]